MVEVSWELFNELMSISQKGIMLTEVKKVKRHSSPELKKYIKSDYHMYMTGAVFGFSPIMDTTE